MRQQARNQKGHSRRRALRNSSNGTSSQRTSSKGACTSRGGVGNPKTRPGHKCNADGTLRRYRNYKPRRSRASIRNRTFMSNANMANSKTRIRAVPARVRGSTPRQMRATIGRQPGTARRTPFTGLPRQRRTRSRSVETPKRLRATHQHEFAEYRHSEQFNATIQPLP